MVVELLTDFRPHYSFPICPACGKGDKVWVLPPLVLVDSSNHASPGPQRENPHSNPLP